ncbi:MAG TPA: type II toxin-antitoxin system HicB family antitoxin [Thiomonas arsenitoxydans]|jgi:predicted HicB family RNase H-like nuclease|uniref:type II toxin-antitoxin system HicB family antitoxin n=1 Tax=Thiomonas TaxID=32012 RepID=UPI00257FBF4A|nr:MULTISPECIES: type II toxin-antitoxin system HicB family antitoxin [Thiomonas]HML81556.1 type II toxin-antitoxin system HicB family antitoxin [Thiomonas arsenitoxydans]
MNNVMTYKGYTASMSYDPDDKILVGRVLDIADIIGFHGESVAEFEQSFHEAIDDYIAACAKLEQEPEKPASGKLMLRIDPSIHAAAAKAAAREGQSMNKWVAKVLADATAHR